jgi:hypothetical protein
LGGGSRLDWLNWSIDRSAGVAQGKKTTRQDAMGRVGLLPEIKCACGWDQKVCLRRSMAEKVIKSARMDLAV